MMSALIFKDVRVNRLPLIAAIVSLLAPYLVTSLAIRSTPLWHEATPASAWGVLLATGSHFSLMVSQVPLAMLSGNMIAAERTDRSAEFLIYLPPSRARVLFSKMIVLGTAVTTIWIVNLLIRAVANGMAGGEDAAGVMTDNLVPLSRFAAIGTCAIGAGWLASATLATSGPAVALAFGAPLAWLGVIAAGHYTLNVPSEFHYASTYFNGCTVVGSTMFVCGSLYFVRRIEP